jgi:DNA ligase-1
MLIKKPMLSASMEDSKGNEMSLSDLEYPLMASIKLDGIRCLTVGGRALSRSFKPIPNKHVQKLMSTLPDGLDGELVTYNADNSIRTFNEVQSDIMSEDGEPNFKFEIFDYVKDTLERRFDDRSADLVRLYDSLPAFCSLVVQNKISSVQELEEYEEQIVSAGHEGIMVRSLKGLYKCGRATFKSQDLIKIKRFKDSEAVVIGFKEKMRNENEATIDELGHTKRSSSKGGLVPANTLGNFVVRDLRSNVEFEIGTGKGLNDLLKKEIWDNQEKYLGKIINYRYQEVGTKDKPRIPSFQGFRDKRDM